jgi:hypothetical protein
MYIDMFIKQKDFQNTMLGQCQYGNGNCRNEVFSYHKCVDDHLKELVELMDELFVPYQSFIFHQNKENVFYD